MDDSEIGFFTIARKVFAQLSQEEQEALDDDSDDLLPDFGNSSTSWSPDVRNFYSRWSSFSTIKSFAWCDAYNLAAAPERRVRRAMEKENKKLRDAGKKEYNDTVRVCFFPFLL